MSDTGDTSLFADWHFVSKILLYVDTLQQPLDNNWPMTVDPCLYTGIDSVVSYILYCR